MHLRKFATAFLFCVSALAITALPERPNFAQETSDLKADPAARFGTLPNGMRYVIMPNNEPKDRASLRLVVMAGSLQETEQQRGLAHYLEHMAFNGSEHFAPGTLVEFFQRMGMNFGGDTNAYTSFEHTTYMIDLPDTKPATLAEGFRVFADFAGGLLLPEKEVDKERGIIFSEMRARDSVEYRQMLAEFQFVLAGSRIPQRMPIGIPTIIGESKRDRFVDFYNTWYRPERMAVIAVGDFDPATVEKDISAKFGSLTARTDLALPNPSLGNLPAFTGIAATRHYEPEAAATTVSIQTVTPYMHEPDTSAKRTAELAREIALSMLNRRLSILAKREGAPFTTGAAHAGEQFDFFRNASIELVCKPETWREALATAEQELRRAQQFGFSSAELAEATANIKNELDQAVKTAATRRSEALARDLISALVEGQVFTSPADDQGLLVPALEKLTPEQCRLALNAAFAAPGRFVCVMGNAKVEGNAADTIKSVYEAAAATAVSAPEETGDSKFGYTDFGPAGKVAKSTHVADLDLTLVTFENGVRLNLKKTDFEAGQIRIGLRVGAGELVEPKDKPGLSFFASAIFSAGGLGKHSVDDLHRILAGKTVSGDFKVGGDALLFAGSTNRDDLKLQFELLAAFLIDPGYRPEALRQAQKGIDQLYRKLDHVPEGPLQREIPRLLAGGDPRFGLPTKQEVSGRSVDEVRAWLKPQLQQGPIEIAVVGDLDVDATIKVVAETFGALPNRLPKPPYKDERHISVPAPFAKDFAVATEIPKGVVALFWPTTDAKDVRVARRLHFLADVLNDRLRVKIREQLGESYSPQAASEPSDVYNDYGLMVAYVVIDPAKASQIADAVASVAHDIAKSGVSADELDRAKKPFLTFLKESVRTNAYWLAAVLGSAQEFPQRLDWCRTRTSDCESITAGELTQLAQKYLTPEHCFRTIVLPQSSGDKKP